MNPLSQTKKPDLVETYARNLTNNHNGRSLAEGAVEFSIPNIFTQADLPDQPWNGGDA